MLNKKNIVSILTIMCALIVIIPSVGSAINRRDEPIVVQCNPSQGSKQYWQKYTPEPHVQMSLTTLGVKISSERDLITVWGTRPGHITVSAKCIPSSHGKPWMNMLPLTFRPKPLPVLTCDKGEGIIVGVEEPVCSGPDEFQYHAMLTIIEDDEEDKAPQQVEEHIVLKPGIGIADPFKQMGMPTTAFSALAIGGMGGGSSF